jgi:hypothetical protein
MRAALKEHADDYSEDYTMAITITFTGSAATLFTTQIAAAKAAGKDPRVLIIPAGSMRVGNPGKASYSPEEALLPNMINLAAREVERNKDGSIKGDGLTSSRANRGQRYADSYEVHADGSFSITSLGGKGAETLRAMVAAAPSGTVNYIQDPRPSAKTYGGVYPGGSVTFGGEGPALGLGANFVVTSDTPESDLADPWANVVPGKRGGGIGGSRVQQALESAKIHFTDVAALKIDRVVLFVGNLAGAKIAFDPTSGSVSALTPTKLASGKPVEMSTDQIRQAAEAYVAKAVEAGTEVDSNWHSLIASVTPAEAAAADATAAA